IWTSLARGSEMRVRTTLPERAKHKAGARRGRKANLGAANRDLLEFRRDLKTRYLSNGSMERGQERVRWRRGVTWVSGRAKLLLSRRQMMLKTGASAISLHQPLFHFLFVSSESL